MDKEAHGDESLPEDGLAGRVERLEALIIEQEHRPFTVFKRFFIDRPKWPDDDPRRAAAGRAVIWSFFFSPLSFAVGGALVGMATIIVLVWQNLLIQDQILRQDRLGVEERRSGAIRMLYEDVYADKPAIRGQALRELAAIAFESEADKRLWVDRGFFTAAGYGQDENLGFDSGLRQSDQEVGDLFPRSLRGVNLENANLRNVLIINLNLENATFNGSDFSNTRIAFTNLRSARFVQRSRLVDAHISRSNLRASQFIGACATGMDLSGSDISGADFSYSDLSRARFADVQNWREAKFTGARLAEITGAPEGFIDHAAAQGAVLDHQSGSSDAGPCGSIQPGRNPSR